MQETRVRFLGREDPLEKEMAIHSSTLAWKIPWMEEPDRLQSMGRKESGTTEWLHFPFLSFPPTSEVPQSRPWFVSELLSWTLSSAHSALSPWLLRTSARVLSMPQGPQCLGAAWTHLQQDANHPSSLSCFPAGLPSTNVTPPLTHSFFIFSSEYFSPFDMDLSS